MENPLSKVGVFISDTRKRTITLVILLLIIPVLIFSIQKLGEKGSLQKPSQETKTSPSQTALTKQANLDITSFMNNNLQPQYFPGNLPSSSGIHQPTDKIGTVIDSKSFFSVWKLKDITILTSVQYVNEKQLDSRRASFTIPVITQPLAVTSTEKLIKQYLSETPQGTWQCSSITRDNKTIVCENFWTESNGTKKGIGIVNVDPILKNEGKSRTIIFLCDLYTGGKSYENKSCSSYIQ